MSVRDHRQYELPLSVRCGTHLRCEVLESRIVLQLNTLRIEAAEGLLNARSNIIENALLRLFRSDFASNIDELLVEQAPKFGCLVRRKEDALPEIRSLTIEIPRLDTREVTAVRFFRDLVQVVEDELDQTTS